MLLLFGALCACCLCNLLLLVRFLLFVLLFLLFLFFCCFCCSFRVCCCFCFFCCLCCFLCCMCCCFCGCLLRRRSLNHPCRFRPQNVKNDFCRILKKHFVSPKRLLYPKKITLVSNYKRRSPMSLERSDEDKDAKKKRGRRSCFSHRMCSQLNTHRFS